MAKSRILIVDDSTFTRTILRKIFEGEGYEVVAEAENGQSGVNMFAHHLPDLVTMDISMPDMTGIEALLKIMRIKSDAKVIMLSARGQKHSVIEAIKNGAKGFIVKPPIKEVIMETVKKVLNDFSIPEANIPISSPGISSNDSLTSISYAKILSIISDKYDMDGYESKQLLDKFILDVPNMMTNLSTAYNNKDFKTLEEQSHKVKGVVANFQLHSISFIASELEKFSIKKDIESCGETLKKLLEVMDILKCLKE